MEKERLRGCALFEKDFIMIKANELRIGNYFIDGDGKYSSAHQIYFLESPSHKYINGWDYDSIDPIPIIPEI